MKKGINLLEQFDHLETIEPSDEWNEKLMNRLSQSGSNHPEKGGSRMVIIAILLLLAINIFSLTRSWMNERSQLDHINLKQIASDYLISTNSSKY